MAGVLSRWRGSNGEVPVDLSAEEIYGIVDWTSRAYLHLTGEQFIQLVRSGAELPDHPIVGHLLLLIGADTSTG